MIAHAQRQAPSGRRLKARIFWLHHSPLATHASVSVRIGSAETRGAITKIGNMLDPGDQSAANRATVGQNHLRQNHIGDVEIALANPIAADQYEANPRTGRIVLDVGGYIAGGGLVLALDDGSQTFPVAAGKSHALAARAASLGRALSGLELAARVAPNPPVLAGSVGFH